VRLPTDGYVRPGRYFPVEVRTDAAVTLAADGCLPCDVAATGRVTVPMLAVTTPGPLLGGGAAIPLRVPADDERLVGTLGDVPAGLFPAGRVIPVRLDPADPLPGPAAAWEVLDAVVLDAPAMAAVDDVRRSVLLAGGVTLAVVADAVPDDRWPWRRRGTAWVLAYAPAGPTGVVDGDAYAPTEMWTPGWSATVREETVVAGVLVCLASLAIVASRRTGVPPVRSATARAGRPCDGNRVVLLAVAVPLAAAGGVILWRSMLDRVARGGGDVTVTGDGWSQRDAWVYDRARSPADVDVPWAGWTHPMFASTSNGARVTVSADGRLAFHVHLGRGAAMAFLRREVRPGTAQGVTGGRGAAMRSLAPMYLSTGDRVAGETAAAAGRWPGVEIVRR
jgi:hypothetical protein